MHHAYQANKPINTCIYIKSKDYQFMISYKHLKYETEITKFSLTCDSYGVKAILISFRVLIRLAAIELHISLKRSSGHTFYRMNFGNNFMAQFYLHEAIVC